MNAKYPWTHWLDSNFGRKYKAYPQGNFLLMGNTVSFYGIVLNRIGFHVKLNIWILFLGFRKHARIPLKSA